MISRRNYLVILMLFITVFIMFMLVGKTNDFIENSFSKVNITDIININHDNILTAEKLNMENMNSYPYGKRSAAIISGNKNDILTGLIKEWCVYSKYFYKVYSYLPSTEEIADYSLILFGDINLSPLDNDILYGYADLGKTMIFTRLPESWTISSDKKFARFFGIDEVVAGEVKADGIKIFSKFMVAGERIYKKGDYFGSKDDTSVIVPHFRLSPGYEVYAVGIFDIDEEDDETEDLLLPPLLWRTKTENSFVFVVGCGVFDGMALLGILTGFMTQESEVNLYPIVNAQTLSLTDFPYFSDENKDEMMSLYSRSSKNLARDILWPNIIQILKEYGGSYNFFAASQLDYMNDVGPDTDFLKFYIGEINKLKGVMGLSLSQISDLDIIGVLDKNYWYYSQNISDYNFTSLYLGSFTEEDLLRKWNHDLLKNIKLVMSDYRAGDMILDIIHDDVLSVKFNLYGYEHETMDDIRMIFIENALGMCNMEANISRVIYPKDSFDEWNNLSRIWSRGETYFKEFSVFDMVTLSEMEKRARRFLALNYDYEYRENEIHIRLDNFDKEAYFILTVFDKSISFIDNGEFTKIKKNKYLIKALDESVLIRLNDENILNKPKNNRIISHDPYDRESQK